MWKRTLKEINDEKKEINEIMILIKWVNKKRNRLNKWRYIQKVEAFLIKFALATRPVQVPIITTFILSIRNATSLYEQTRHHAWIGNDVTVQWARFCCYHLPIEHWRRCRGYFPLTASPHSLVIHYWRQHRVGKRCSDVDSQHPTSKV